MVKVDVSSTHSGKIDTGDQRPSGRLGYGGRFETEGRVKLTQDNCADL